MPTKTRTCKVQKVAIWQPCDNPATVFTYRRHLLAAKAYRPTKASIRRLRKALRAANVTGTWFTPGGLSVDYRPAPLPAVPQERKRKALPRSMRTPSADAHCKQCGVEYLAGDLKAGLCPACYEESQFAI